MGFAGNTSSASGAALSVIRRAPQEGQEPRRLQLKATSFSAWQPSQRTRKKHEAIEQRRIGPVAFVARRIDERWRTRAGPLARHSVASLRWMAGWTLLENAN
jgi:hypothetical protein